MTATLVYLNERRAAFVPLVMTVPLCEAQPSAMCTCGGMLAYLEGRWQHVEACVECYDSPEPCHARYGHKACAAPEVTDCVHGNDWHCGNPASIEQTCANGEEPRACCGCCWVHADDLEGRAMWPR